MIKQLNLQKEHLSKEGKEILLNKNRLKFWKLKMMEEKS
jgi:hypothetical protein